MKMKFNFPWSSCFYFSSETTSNQTRQGAKVAPNVIGAFSYEELKQATCSFRSSNKIGEGGFGCVYKGTLEDGRVVAVKVLSAESRQGDREFMSEINSMSKFSHENLVQLYGGCIGKGQSRILVYEYMENNSLAQALLGEENRANFSWKSRTEICLGIARGLAHIHEEIKPHVVHRDIKASNILLDQNFNPKISDFGLSKLFPNNISYISTRVAGTLGYLAPDYAISGHLTRKSDVYSFGVLLLEIVSGRTAVDFDPQLGEYYLVEKAWEMYEEEKLIELVDPMLKGKFSKTEAVRFMEVGLMCVQENRRLRPVMSLAMKMLSGEINLQDQVEITQPGVISDIRNVKLRQSFTPAEKQ
ncbi:putative serine/threonine-protein kinase [Apium graveolens]|uniref:putative serine/threonine-protein kinase n=1 Tax=Apium graveolens TaxID=4045 RepID=UPI003D7AD639